MKKLCILASVLLLVWLVACASFAASGATGTAKAKAAKPHTSLLSKMLHHGAKPAATAAGSGQIIGDKKSHVYHLPGDKYPLPAEKNRVYFKTEAQAIAAGYRHAGAKAGGNGAKSAKVLKKAKAGHAKKAKATH